MTTPREEFEAALAELDKSQAHDRDLAYGAVLEYYAAAIARAEQAERERDENWKLAEFADVQRMKAVRERDEWKQRAEKAEAELLRMHDAVGSLAAGLPRHVAALVAERDAARAALAEITNNCCHEEIDQGCHEIARAALTAHVPVHYTDPRHWGRVE